jgi:predicted lipid-binding transport protein (Tim44 family)
LHEFLSEDMFAQVQQTFQSNDATVSRSTEVFSLASRWMGLRFKEHACLVSVELSGLIREEQAQSPTAFREIWTWVAPQESMHLPLQQAHWLVCEVQALH